MQASAYQMMRTEINQLQREVNGRDMHIQQLAQTLTQRDQTIFGLQLTVAALVYLQRPAAAPPKRSWWKALLAELGLAKPHLELEGPDVGTIRVPKLLVEEINSAPHHFEPRQVVDEVTKDVIFTTRRRTATEIAETEAKIQAQQDELAKQLEEQEAAAKSGLVAADGNTPARATAGKLVVVGS